MKVCVLASGSAGNCSVITTSKVSILVDLGTTCLYAEKKLKELGILPDEISGIFLTHTHVDHISGLRVFLKKHHPTVYLTKKMHDELGDSLVLTDYVYIDDSLDVSDLHVDVFKTSHDVADSNGYIFSCDGKSIVYITDTGYINVKNYPKLKNKNVYIMESNHDVKMLLEGSYPYHLKQRILGDTGHLSNKDSSYYLSNFIGDQTSKVILIHLSKDNNAPALALQTLEDTLRKQQISFDNIEISYQTEKTELVEV